MSNINVMTWFRRDLRLVDNAAFHAACQAKPQRVYAVFIFDSNILSTLSANDRRIPFLHDTVRELKQALQENGGDLICLHGDPIELIPELARKLECNAVFAGKDYEPYARTRDEEVGRRLAAMGKSLLLKKDQVIFDTNELLTGSGKPYTVFTPYMKRWLQAFHQGMLTPFENEIPALATQEQLRFPSLAELGFTEEEYKLPAGRSGALQLLDDFSSRISRYQELRDFPAKKGVSYLSAHLRFGTISIREVMRVASQESNAGSECWMKELIWREFYQQLLWHFPHAAESSFKEEYRELAYPNNQDWFDAWCEGRTGYPIVDAAMRQLNSSGYMHNRLRMIVASFLVKDLLIDWRWGERYFAEKLLDFDLAANNGGWQWAASTGCDAQPYFRIFNPVTQSEKFDPEGQFIRRYVPELAKHDNKAIHAPWLAKNPPLGFRLGRDYPEPIVDHATQRKLALELFCKQ